MHGIHLVPLNYATLAMIFASKGLSKNRQSQKGNKRLFGIMTHRKQYGSKAQKALCSPRFFKRFQIPLKKLSAPFDTPPLRAGWGSIRTLWPFSLKPQRKDNQNITKDTGELENVFSKEEEFGIEPEKKLSRMVATDFETIMPYKDAWLEKSDI